MTNSLGVFVVAGTNNKGKLECLAVDTNSGYPVMAEGVVFNCTVETKLFSTSYDAHSAKDRLQNHVTEDVTGIRVYGLLLEEVESIDLSAIKNIDEQIRQLSDAKERLKKGF